MNPKRPLRIKNCPFCACEFLDCEHDRHNFWMTCLYCGTGGPNGYHFGNALSKWNNMMSNRIAGIDFGTPDGQAHLRPFCLRACPFCGEAEKGLNIMGEEETAVFWCACDTCGTDGPYAAEKKIAVRMWNRRIRVNSELGN